MKAYILAAGAGKRMSPYGECRAKTLLPVAGKSILNMLCDALQTSGVTDVTVVAGPFESDIRGALAGRPGHEICVVGETSGTADSLLRAMNSDDASLVMYGDVVLAPEDIAGIADAARQGTAAVLVAPLEPGESRDCIAARVTDGKLAAIVGHPREGVSHRLAGFATPRRFTHWLESCPAHFPRVEVGMMPPQEKHLEAALEMYRAAGNDLRALEATTPCFDLDKPWQILSANKWWAARQCSQLTANELSEDAEIHKSAHVDGYVRLGNGSKIGRNVIVRGNLIAGENTVLDAGAIINGNAVIGDGCVVANGCFVEDGSVIGDECVVNHAAELDGVIFKGVYLYHYMEIYGVVGERSDIGAATVCGSLRFDDGFTMHKIRGRRELPREFSNATFIGDYCRTGVNVTILPGRKIGPYSIVGPGVLLDRDVPPRTGVRVSQDLDVFTWGPERYGW